MKRHRVLRAATAVLMAFLVAATPAMATTSSSTEREQFLVFLPGINGDGTLNWEGTSESDEYSDGDFVVVTSFVNTYTGKFCFFTCGCVVNESCQCHHYPNENFFGPDLTDGSPDIGICFTCYTVSKPCRCISKVTYFGVGIDEDEAP